MKDIGGEAGRTLNWEMEKANHKEATKTKAPAPASVIISNYNFLEQMREMEKKKKTLRTKLKKGPEQQSRQEIYLARAVIETGAHRTK